ncbi:MAG: hypothetical protein ACI9WS_001592 [Paraglaciecola psychrophila]|jgi:hypothetical protein
MNRKKKINKILTRKLKKVNNKTQQPAKSRYISKADRIATAASDEPATTAKPSKPTVNAVVT